MSQLHHFQPLQFGSKGYTPVSTSDLVPGSPSLMLIFGVIVRTKGGIVRTNCLYSPEHVKSDSLQSLLAPRPQGSHSRVSALA